MTTLQGIDVSASGQGLTFDWPAWRGRIQFAAVKISQGTGYADPAAKRNIAGARSLGLFVIGYHFLLNDPNPRGGESQAEWFLKCAKAAGLKPGDGIAQDIEDGGLNGNSAGHFDLVAAGFDNQVGSHFRGFHPIAYTEISMAPALVHLGSSPLWLANPSGAKIRSIGQWKGGPSFEQTGQRQVDTDVFYGDLAALKRLAFPA